MNNSVYFHGYITLMSVLITGAIALVIGVSLLLLGIGAAKTSLAIEQSNQAKALTNACTERALDQLRQNVT
jgi:hypothetical protein